MDAGSGLAAVNARIQEIRSQLGMVSAAAPAATAAATAPGFEGALATAVRAHAATSTAAGAGPAGSSTGASAGSSATTGPASARPGASARLNAAGVPVDLARYGNGRVPASALASIGGHDRLWAPAAQSFTAMRAAAARDGVSFGVSDSYRSYGEQVELARRKGLYSNGGLAARPGTSDHGWGLSVDLHLDAGARAWLRTNAARFGFTENVPRESWHWTYAPKS